ncbi:AC transposable element-derived protein 4 [Colletotrichum musicola]|uniref:AC transposable element-derived protein 4 n=1 Tax=Colletotrichum musicola TaxID=2175873 RepID=A0A8H6ILU5_9PEZI|nr:AC transposable element-derived protein 4 [Colletotrichum musicola]
MDSDGSDAADTSVRDCITVAVLPEDLAAACTDACRPERCDEATVRPHEEPGVDRGVPGSFVLFEIPEREAEIRALPAEPLDLFLRYVPYEVVDRWAEWTNTAAATAQYGPLRRRSRIKAWRPTIVHEIYLFLGILIYMGLYSESQVFRYWSTSQDQEDPIYLFTRFITRDRFQLLLRHIQIFNPADFPNTSTPSKQRRRDQARKGLMPKVYRQVNG